MLTLAGSHLASDEAIGRRCCEATAINFFLDGYTLHAQTTCSRACSKYTLQSANPAQRSGRGVHEDLIWTHLKSPSYRNPSVAFGESNLLACDDTSCRHHVTPCYRNLGMVISETERSWCKCHRMPLVCADSPFCAERDSLRQFFDGHRS